MKRMLGIISAVALTAGLVSADSVESQNIVGYHTMPIVGGGFNMVAVNWDAIGGDEIHIQNLFEDVSGLEMAATAGQADNLLIWDPITSGYTTYFLYDSGGTYPDWDGTWVNLAGTEIIEDSLPMGKGAWYISRGAVDIEWVQDRPY